MKPDKSLISLLGLIPAAVLAFAMPTIGAQQATPAAVAAVPAYTDEQKTALKALDAELVRFDAMLEKDDDVQHKATVKAFIDAFKEDRKSVV